MRNRILVVDYEKKAVDEFRLLFQAEEFELDTAVDGMQALDFCAKNKPDIVFASALLPKLNGFELSKRISSGPLTTRCPVVIYSGIYKAEKYRKEAIEGCGASEFLEKPFTKSQLLRIIRQLTPSLQEQEDAVLNLDDAPVTLPSQPSTGDPLEVDSLFEARLQWRQEPEGQVESVMPGKIGRGTAEQDSGTLDLTQLPEPDLELEIPDIQATVAATGSSGIPAASPISDLSEVLELEPEIHPSPPAASPALELFPVASEPALEGESLLQIDLGDQKFPDDVYIDRMPELELESLVEEVRSLESRELSTSPTEAAAEADTPPPAVPSSREAWEPHFITLSHPASPSSHRVWFIVAGLLLLLIIGGALYLFIDQ